jgi:hypothetical protein
VSELSAFLSSVSAFLSSALWLSDDDRLFGLGGSAASDRLDSELAETGSSSAPSSEDSDELVEAWTSKRKSCFRYPFKNFFQPLAKSRWRRKSRHNWSLSNLLIFEQSSI